MENESISYKIAIMLLVLMLFYLLIMANFITSKLNKHLIEHINNNKITQHLLGIITILVILCLIYNDMNVYDMIIYTFVIYFVFVLSTKLNQNVLYVSLTLLLLFFIKEYYNNKKINLIIKDENIDGMIKEISRLAKPKYIQNYILFHLCNLSLG